MGPRLAWVPLLGACIGSAVDGMENLTVGDTIDPLQKTITIAFRDPLPGHSWNPLQILVHCFAMANDCSVSKIKKTGKNTYTAYVSTKRRLGPTMKNNPFTMDKWKSTSQQKKEEFFRRLRDKVRTLERSSP